MYRNIQLQGLGLPLMWFGEHFQTRAGVFCKILYLCWCTEACFVLALCLLTLLTADEQADSSWGPAGRMAVPSVRSFSFLFFRLCASHPILLFSSCDAEEQGSGLLPAPRGLSWHSTTPAPALVYGWVYSLPSFPPCPYRPGHRWTHSLSRGRVLLGGIISWLLTGWSNIKSPSWWAQEPGPSVSGLSRVLLLSQERPPPGHFRCVRSSAAWSIPGSLLSLWCVLQGPAALSSASQHPGPGLGRAEP